MPGMQVAWIQQLNRQSVRKKAVIAIAALGAVLMGCSLNPDKRSYRHSEAGRTNSDDQKKVPPSGQCLRIRSGEKVERDTKANKTFAGTGKIISRSNHGYSICTGTLLQPNVVLTARHCVTNDQGELKAVDHTTFSLGDGAPVYEVKQIIDWDQQGTPQDVVLLVLNHDYDETLPYYQLVSSRINPDDASEVTMVGFGGYTDGKDVESYSIGEKRIGQAHFERYGILPVDGTVREFMVVQPTGRDKQLICEGDSGSALHWQTGYEHFLLGVTSLLDADVGARTPEELCAYGLTAYYVPGYEIGAWVQKKLVKINNGGATVATTSAYGSIRSLEKHDGYTKVELRTETMIENRLGLKGQTITFNLCYSKCDPSRIQADISIGEKVYAVLKRDTKSGSIVAQSIADSTNPATYKVAFVATISDIADESDAHFGREERSITFSRLERQQGYGLVPHENGRIAAVICEDGCSQKTTHASDLKLEKGQRVLAIADVLRSGTFIREFRVAPESTDEPLLPYQEGGEYGSASYQCLVGSM